jgi:CubicO group peptidase (beta-lactamase class C family)
MVWLRGTVVMAFAAAFGGHASAASPIGAAVTAYVEPYVRTNNFAGAVLVARDGVPLYSRSFGFADRKQRTPNSLQTQFHVASMSMQFTAAAILRLIDRGSLSLETMVAEIIPNYPNGDRITVRHLLTQTSGIADINDLPDYDQLLATHQSPQSLVDKISKVPPKRQPGTFEREEHSAYNLLALIIEKRTKQPFPRAVRGLVFQPLGMARSGIDDDSAPTSAAAKGYSPVGLDGLEPAPTIHWSAKAGNGSAYTTAEDELKFVNGLFRRGFLSERLRRSAFNLDQRVGYGWFKSNSTRFGTAVYSMNGRAPGFASAVVYVPARRLTVIALSNIYASVAPDVANDLAAVAMRLPYQPLALGAAVDPTSLRGLPASFRFAKDFYQPDAVVRVAAGKDGVQLHWPSGDVSALIPTGRDHFIDRSYWVPVHVQRDAAGAIVTLRYDRFEGRRVAN